MPHTKEGYIPRNRELREYIDRSQKALDCVYTEDYEGAIETLISLRELLYTRYPQYRKVVG